MWDSIVGTVSSVANAAVAGTIGTGEKLPFSCQVPFKKFEENMNGCEDFSLLFHTEAESLRASPKWVDMEFEDPEGGDMKIMTQDQVGTYHFVKATFTIKNAKNSDVFKILTSDRKDVRGKFSADLAELEYLAEKGDQVLLHIAYAAPGPGGAGRDFVFLAGEKTTGDKKEAWGCSVDVKSRPEDYEGYVRGACLYHWECTQKGDDTWCQYTGVFDPRGWAPPFLIAWFKSSATNEFRAVRKLCQNQGKDVATFRAERQTAAADADAGAAAAAAAATGSADDDQVKKDDSKKEEE